MGILVLAVVVIAVVVVLHKNKKTPVKQTSSTGRSKKTKRTSSARSHAIQSAGSGGGKSNKRKEEKTFQRHFRKFHSNKTTGHPSYVYGEKGKNYKIIGITSSPQTKGQKNIELDKNPEPGNSKQAYLRPEPTTINKGERNDKLKGWKFSNNDKKKVQAVIDKDKK